MSEKRLLDDCFLHDTDRLSHAETLAIIGDRLSTVTDREIRTLQQADRCFLADDVAAPRNVPLHDNAAVDGYAYAASDWAGIGGRFPVTARIAAGDLDPTGLAPGSAARIFTGAIMPTGADTVAMQEDCTVSADGTSVVVPTGLKAGANRRMAGEDLRQGENVIAAGQRLRPQDIAALASLGISRVPVFSHLRVALLSTGNEIVEPGERTLHPGQVFDSNRNMLKSLCNTLPTAVTDYGILPDDPGIIENAVAEAARHNDLILATGGTSRGEEDHIVASIDKLGKRHSWQIAIKPGRPMSFGQIGDCVFIGLPGNPVAAFVCFLLYARKAMILLSGGRYQETRRFSVPAGFSIASKKPDRREFLRGWLETDDQGHAVVHKFPRDGSGLISGLRQASGLIELPEAATSVTEGEPVSFLPFASFGLDG